MSLNDLYEMLKPLLEKLLEFVKSFLGNYFKTDATEE